MFKMLFHVTFVVACVTISVGAASTKIPDYIKICKRSDPKVEDCIRSSIEQIKPHLKKGIPELDIPTLEPLYLAQVGSGKPDENGFMAVGRNVKAYGVSNFNVDKLKLDLSTENRPTVHLALSFPKLDFEGEYEINAKVLVLPIQGKGPITFNATNTKVDGVLYGQVYKKGNNNYLRFIRIDMDLKTEDYTVHLENLFNGDKLLGEATNQALNENKKEFINALSPVVTRTVSEIALDIANKVAKNQLYDVLFPK